MRSGQIRIRGEARYVYDDFGDGFGEPRINLPGPDLSAGALAAMLAPLGDRRVVVVNAASASGGFIEALSAPGRVVITATRSAAEAEATRFGGHFVAALGGADAALPTIGRPEGFFRVEPPTWGAGWQDTYDPQALEPGVNSGFVSLSDFSNYGLLTADGVSLLRTTGQGDADSIDFGSTSVNTTSPPS